MIDIDSKRKTEENNYMPSCMNYTHQFFKSPRLTCEATSNVCRLLLDLAPNKWINRKALCGVKNVAYTTETLIKGSRSARYTLELAQSVNAFVKKPAWKTSGSIGFAVSKLGSSALSLVQGFSRLGYLVLSALTCRIMKIVKYILKLPTTIRTIWKAKNVLQEKPSKVNTEIHLAKQKEKKALLIQKVSSLAFRTLFFVLACVGIATMPIFCTICAAVSLTTKIIHHIFKVDRIEQEKYIRSY